MSIFSKIKKSKQAADEHRKSGGPPDAEPTPKSSEDKPKYKHVPKHAAADALTASSTPDSNLAEQLKVQRQRIGDNPPSKPNGGVYIRTINRAGDTAVRQQKPRDLSISSVMADRASKLANPNQMPYRYSGPVSTLGVRPKYGSSTSLGKSPLSKSISEEELSDIPDSGAKSSVGSSASNSSSSSNFLEMKLPMKSKVKKEKEEQKAKDSEKTKDEEAKQSSSKTKSKQATTKAEVAKSPKMTKVAPQPRAQAPVFNLDPPPMSNKSSTASGLPNPSFLAPQRQAERRGNEPVVPSLPSPPIPTKSNGRISGMSFDRTPTPGKLLSSERSPERPPASETMPPLNKNRLTLNIASEDLDWFPDYSSLATPDSTDRSRDSSAERIAELKAIRSGKFDQVLPTQQFTPIPEPSLQPEQATLVEPSVRGRTVSSPKHVNSSPHTVEQSQAQKPMAAVERPQTDMLTFAQRLRRQSEQNLQTSLENDEPLPKRVLDAENRPVLSFVQPERNDQSQRVPVVDAVAQNNRQTFNSAGQPVFNSIYHEADPMPKARETNERSYPQTMSTQQQDPTPPVPPILSPMPEVPGAFPPSAGLFTSSEAPSPYSNPVRDSSEWPISPKFAADQQQRSQSPNVEEQPQPTYPSTPHRQQSQQQGQEHQQTMQATPESVHLPVEEHQMNGYTTPQRQFSLQQSREQQQHTPTEGYPLPAMEEYGQYNYSPSPNRQSLPQQRREFQHAPVQQFQQPSPIVEEGESQQYTYSTPPKRALSQQQRPSREYQQHQPQHDYFTPNPNQSPPAKPIQAPNPQQPPEIPLASKPRFAPSAPGSPMEFVRSYSPAMFSIPESPNPAMASGRSTPQAKPYPGNETYTNQFGGQLLRYPSQDSAHSPRNQRVSDGSWGTAEMIPRDNWVMTPSPPPLEVLHHHIYYTNGPQHHQGQITYPNNYNAQGSMPHERISSTSVDSMSLSQSRPSRSQSRGRAPSRLSDRPLLNQHSTAKGGIITENVPLETNRSAPKPPNPTQFDAPKQKQFDAPKQRQFKNTTWTPPIPPVEVKTPPINVKEEGNKKNVKRKSSRVFSMLGRKDRNSTVPVH